MASEARVIAMELLKSGASPVEVADAIGVDISYVVGLANDPTFAATLRGERALKLNNSYVRDNNIDAIEDLVLGKLAQVLKYEQDTSKLTKAFQTLNSAKRRTNNEQFTSESGATIVQLQLPDFLMKQATAVTESNHQGEVVSIDGRLLQTMGSEQLLREAGGVSEDVRKMVASKEAMGGILPEEL